MKHPYESDIATTASAMAAAMRPVRASIARHPSTANTAAMP